jgi:hypothetical protein
MGHVVAPVFLEQGKGGIRDAVTPAWAYATSLYTRSKEESGLCGATAPSKGMFLKYTP